MSSEREYREWRDQQPAVVVALFHAAAGYRARANALDDEQARARETLERVDPALAKTARELAELEHELARHGYRLDVDGRLEGIPAPAATS